MLKPKWVFYACLIVAFSSLLVNGTFFKLWEFQQEYKHIQRRQQSIENELLEYQIKMKQAQDPEWIERWAKERYELAREGDLIFIFSE